jgi:drug/metabolite transporter (DMT)-like permease
VSKRGWLLFAAMSVIWGIPYLLIRIAVRDLTPPDLVFARTGIAALLLLPVAAKRGLLRPLLPKWRVIVVYTVVEIAGPWLLLSRAEERLSSSLAGLLVASVPLVGAVVAVIAGRRGGHQEDKLDGRRLLGLLVGLLGVAVLVGVDVSGGDAWSVVEIAITAIGYSVGPMIISRKLADLPVLGVVAASLGLTAIGYAPIALTELPRHLSAEVGWSVIGLALICTALAFLVFFALIAEVGPARATVITYLNPAIALLLGVVVLSEPFTLGIGIGFPLILAGCFLATSRNRVPAVPAASPASPTQPLAPSAASTASCPSGSAVDSCGL